MVGNRGPTLFFCTLIFSFPSTICWRIFSFLQQSWHPCWKTIDYKGEFLSQLSILLHWFMSILMSSPNILDYCNLVVNFEIWEESSNFVLFQDCFGCHHFYASELEYVVDTIKRKTGNSKFRLSHSSPPLARSHLMSLVRLVHPALLAVYCSLWSHYS